jgi:serine/threonine protein kinase
MSEKSHWSTTAPLPLQAMATVPSEPEAHAHDALLPGTRLDEFEIIRVLGAGGFGIVYLALDHVLLRQVAIKEYMPTALAGRGRGAMVSVRSAALAETFAMGLESFFSEARMLASFDHPSLVKVHRFWKANGTAYMVMPYYAGQTLKEARGAMSGPPDEAWLRASIEPLLGAIDLLHGQGIYHRDIAPDNILLLPDGRPVLLDFGSARRVIGDRTQSLTAILKPNFAPVEQYADEAGMRQGPWTDLYALGATMHFVLTGQAPTPAVLRAVRDALPALSAPDGPPFPGVPASVLATIDWAMALAPEDRPQSVASVRQALCGEIVPPPPSVRHPALPRLPPPPTSYHDITIIDTVTVPEVVAKTIPGGPRVASVVAPAWRGRRAVLALLGLAGLAAVGWGAWALKLPATAPPAALTAVTVPPTAAASANSDAAALVPAAGRRPSAEPEPVPPIAPRRTRTAADAAAAAAKAPVNADQRSPKEACDGRNFFARAMCVSRQCAMPRWQAHPDCADARRMAEERQRQSER